MTPSLYKFGKTEFIAIEEIAVRVVETENTKVVAKVTVSSLPSRDTPTWGLVGILRVAFKRITIKVNNRVYI